MRNALVGAGECRTDDISGVAASPAEVQPLGSATGVRTVD